MDVNKVLDAFFDMANISESEKSDKKYRGIRPDLEDEELA